MPSLFLDASGWFAALSPRDEGHDVARRAYEGAARSGDLLITTPFVIAEVHALMLRWLNPHLGVRFLEAAFESGAHVVVIPDAELIESALGRWVRRFADQPFSLCDAISFEVMRRERVAKALTFDRHFVVAGFEILR
jgi:hypothetical protein